MVLGPGAYGGHRFEEAAAEFAEWFVRRVLPGRRGLHLIEPGSMRMVDLSDPMTAAQILDAIR